MALNTNTDKQTEIIPFPADKMIAFSKMKAFAVDKLNVTPNITSIFHRVKNIVVKRGKWWLPTYFPFPTMLLGGFFLMGIRSCHCMVNRYPTTLNNYCDILFANILSYPGLCNVCLFPIDPFPYMPWLLGV